MGKRAAAFLQLIPEQTYVSVSPVKASPSTPQAIDATQHSFATGGRHPGFTVGLYMTNGDTATFLVPVAPSCLYVRVSFLMQGAGTVLVQSVNHTGSSITFNGADQASPVPAGLGLKETNIMPGAVLNGPLKVRSSNAWTWTQEWVTVTFTTSAAGTGAVHSMCFQPIFGPTNV